MKLYLHFPMFLYDVHLGKCNTKKTMTLVASVHHFTSHGVLQEHNSMALKAKMYIVSYCILYFRRSVQDYKSIGIWKMVTSKQSIQKQLQYMGLWLHIPYLT
jgi:hypothetical protein